MAEACVGRKGGEEQGSGPHAEGEAYLKHILATAPIGIAVVRGRILEDVNDSLCALSGYSRDELLGESTRKLFPDDAEFERTGRALYGNEQEESIRTAESRLRAKDDSILDVLLRVAPLHGGSADVRAYTKIVMDVGERKRAQEALESRINALTSPDGPFIPGSSLRFDMLFDLNEIQKIQDAFSEATGVASIITDVDGNPLTKPSNFTRLCMQVIRGTKKGCENCYRSDAALGKLNRLGPLMSPCLSGGLWDGGAGISAGDRHIANWLIGQVVDDSIDLERIRSYASEIGVDQAVFDSALAEVPRMTKARFAKICDALFLIARQLSTLAYDNILQARAIAERRKAAEEKDALYRELKHRVKNSMTLITALVDLEAGRSEAPMVRAALGATKARIESLATLYDVLGGSADPAEIRLDSYLSRIVHVVEAAFDEAIAALDFRCDFRPIAIQARSAAPLGLILMELLTNAIKYAFSPGTGGTVSMALSLDSEARVVLTVEDDGVGLPVGFDPRESAGLGMELILMLVSQLNGELEIGGGARFLVRLPAGSGHEADEKSGDSV
jgi:PAS domain S-box-containing protein